MVCTVITYSSRTSLECALNFDCSAKTETDKFLKRSYKIYDLVFFGFVGDQKQTSAWPSPDRDTQLVLFIFTMWQITAIVQ